MHSTLKLVSGYVIVEDKIALLDYMARNAKLDDAGYRFIAYRAYELGQPALALYALNLVQHRIPTDDLAEVFIHLRVGNDVEIRNALARAMEHPWRVLLPSEEELQNRMLRHVQQSAASGQFAPGVPQAYGIDSETSALESNTPFGIKSLCLLNQ